MRQVTIRQPTEMALAKAITASGWTGAAARSLVLISINPFAAVRDILPPFCVLEKTHGVAIKRLSQWNYDPTSLYL